MENKFIYLLRDCYDETIVFMGLIFNEELTKEKRIEIECKMNEIKNSPEYIGEWQVNEIVDELHKIYDFEEIYFEPKYFVI